MTSDPGGAPSPFVNYTPRWRGGGPRNDGGTAGSGPRASVCGGWAGGQLSRESAFLACVTDSSEAGPPGFSVASAWLRVTKGRIRRS